MILGKLEQPLLFHISLLIIILVVHFIPHYNFISFIVVIFLGAGNMTFESI